VFIKENVRPEEGGDKAPREQGDRQSFGRKKDTLKNERTVFRPKEKKHREKKEGEQFSSTKKGFLSED